MTGYGFRSCDNNNIWHYGGQQIIVIDRLCLHAPEPKLHNLFYLLRYAYYSECNTMSASEIMTYNALFYSY